MNRWNWSKIEEYNLEIVIYLGKKIVLLMDYPACMYYRLIRVLMLFPGVMIMRMMRMFRILVLLMMNLNMVIIGIKIGSGMVIVCRSPSKACKRYYYTNALKSYCMSLGY